MPKAQRTETFDINHNDFYNVVIDYESYSEFVDHVTRVEILKKIKDGVRAEFHLNMIRSVSYVLDLHHDPGKRVWWELVQGDIFRKMDGAWDLTPRGKKKTQVTYTADVETKIIAPAFIVKNLVSFSLPAMMKSFYQRTRDL